jgi:uncharacterized protein YcbX
MLDRLQAGADADSRLNLTRESEPQTDVRPLSLLSLQTVEALSFELGAAIDIRRFRANLLLEMDEGAFAEDHLVSRTIEIGEARLLVKERTPRCRFVTYDPARPKEEEPLFSLMKLLDRLHEGRVGVYASVMQAGGVRSGDEVRVVG